MSTRRDSPLSQLVAGVVVLIAGVLVLLTAEPGGSTRRLGIPSRLAGWIGVIGGVLLVALALRRWRRS